MPSSDLSSDDLFFPPPHPKDKARETQCSGLVPAPKRVKIDTASRCIELEDEEIKMSVEENGKKYELDVSPLEQLHTFLNIGPSTKIKYKNMYISKYITLKGLDYTSGEIIHLIGPDVLEEVTKDLLLKINFDFFENFTVKIDKNKKIGDLLAICKEKSSIKREKLVMNGEILNDKDIIGDILDNGDLLDYISL